jgi:NAD(P)-dependent dehydrogenase (short-subunit alcohol dehydrogenase family)
MTGTYTNTALDGEVALITGASRGIGAAIAEAFCAAGATVVGTATSEAGAAAITAQLGGKGRGIVLDIADEQSVAAAIKEVQANEGSPTIVVNNAGITRDNLLRWRVPGQQGLPARHDEGEKRSDHQYRVCHWRHG